MSCFDPDTYLLIDDNETFANLLMRGFKHKNLLLDWAKNGEEAFAKDLSYEGIILDLNLEEESGLRLLPNLILHYPYSKVIILTGYSSISTAVKAIKMGAVQYLPKPATIDAILHAFSSKSDFEENDEEIVFERPSLKRFSWEYIQLTLNQYEGNISATARALGMHRRTLQRILSKHPTKR